LKKDPGGGPDRRRPSPMTPLARQLRLYIAIRVVAIVSVLLPFGLFQLWLLPASPQSNEPALSN